MKLRLIIILFIALALSGCADSLIYSTIEDVELLGFWHGLWHGFILTFSFIGSLFSDDIAIYAINNNGGWYDFGFIYGMGLWREFTK